MREQDDIAVLCLVEANLDVWEYLNVACVPVPTSDARLSASPW